MSAIVAIPTLTSEEGTGKAVLREKIIINMLENYVYQSDVTLLSVG